MQTIDLTGSDEPITLDTVLIAQREHFKATGEYEARLRLTPYQLNQFYRCIGEAQIRLAPDSEGVVKWNALHIEVAGVSVTGVRSRMYEGLPPMEKADDIVAVEVTPVD